MATFIVGDQHGEAKVPQPLCFGCNKKPEELDEYIEQGELNDMSPSAFVCLFEGTLNRVNGHFLCTPCYVDAGAPSRPFPQRWTTP